MALAIRAATTLPRLRLTVPESARQTSGGWHRSGQRAAGDGYVASWHINSCAHGASESGMIRTCVATSDTGPVLASGLRANQFSQCRELTGDLTAEVAREVSTLGLLLQRQPEQTLAE